MRASRTTHALGDQSAPRQAERRDTGAATGRAATGAPRRRWEPAAPAAARGRGAGRRAAARRGVHDEDGAPLEAERSSLRPDSFRPGSAPTRRLSLLSLATALLASTRTASVCSRAREYHAEREPDRRGCESARAFALARARGDGDARRLVADGGREAAATLAEASPRGRSLAAGQVLPRDARARRVRQVLGAIPAPPPRAKRAAAAAFAALPGADQRMCTSAVLFKSQYDGAARRRTAARA